MGSFIIHAVENKLISLNQPHFQSADEYELLVYDNSHLAIMLHVKEALLLLQRSLQAKLKAVSLKREFDCLSVIHSDELNRFHFRSYE